MISSCKISDKRIFALRAAEKDGRKIALYQQSQVQPSPAPANIPKRLIVFGDLSR